MKKNENPSNQNQPMSYNDLVANSAPYNKQKPREPPSNPNQYVHRDRASSHKNMNSGKFTDKKLDPSPTYSFSGNLFRKAAGDFPENEFGKISSEKSQRHRLLGDDLDQERKGESIKNYNLGRNHEIKSVVENITNKLLKEAEELHKNCLGSTAGSKFFGRGETKRGPEVVAHRGNPENYHINPEESIRERYYRKARPSTANPDAGRPDRNKSVLSRTEKSFAERIMGERSNSNAGENKMFSESVSVNNRPA